MTANISFLGQSTFSVVGLMTLKLWGVVVLWITTRWPLRIALRWPIRFLRRYKMDRALLAYVEHGAGILIDVALVIGLLRFFGLETDTSVALLAGVCIGLNAAGSSVLSNLAAGVVLIALQSFRVGEVVSVAGITGTVREIGLCNTMIDTPENIRTAVQNRRIFAEIGFAGTSVAMDPSWRLGTTTVAPAASAPASRFVSAVSTPDSV